MNFSQPNLPAHSNASSLNNADKISTAAALAVGAPGSLNDESAIREAVTEAIRNCGKTREVIVEEMSYLLGVVVSKRSLDSYTSEAADQHRFPAQYLRAFCTVTGDWRALTCVIERSVLQVVGPAEQKLLELGRNYLRQKRAAAAMASLEEQLAEVQL